MNLFVKGEYGRVMTITPEELKEKLGITFDIVALGIEVNDGDIDDDSVFLVERYDVSGVVGRGLKDTESQLFMQALDEVMKGAGNDCQGTEKDA